MLNGECLADTITSKQQCIHGMFECPPLLLMYSTQLCIVHKRSLAESRDFIGFREK